MRYHGYHLGYFPDGPRGGGSWGLYVDTLPKALLAAAVCLAVPGGGAARGQPDDRGGPRDRRPALAGRLAGHPARMR